MEEPKKPDTTPLSPHLKAGTISVACSDSFITSHALRLDPSARTGEDGWQLLSEDTLDSYVHDEELLCLSMKHLLEQERVKGTYRLCDNSRVFLIRIYLIPFDLEGDNDHDPSPRTTTALRVIFSLISKSKQLWEGIATAGAIELLLPQDIDNRSLNTIFSELQSPSPAKAGAWNSSLTTRLLDFNDQLGGLGLRSTLYKYQRQTVATMIQMEMDQRQIPNPLYITLCTQDNKTFFLQPGTMKVVRTQPVTPPGRGGILCEELGTGKTVMVLALILATIEQLSSPVESTPDDPRPIMTPLSFRYFQTDEARAARSRFFRNDGDALDVNDPSFEELTMHLNRVHSPTSANSLESYGQLGELSSQLRRHVKWRRNVPFYHQYPPACSRENRLTRNSVASAPRVVYLTSATLIVVPHYLLGQWKQEVQKHCATPLRMLVLASGDNAAPIPCAAALASDYDVVLMTYTRLSNEGRTEGGLNNLQNLHSWDLCNCRPIPGSRVPNCSCRNPMVSPLLQVRWKRMVIDEGHVSASPVTNLVHFARFLSVEKKWVVTGTPTTNLAGLGPGAQVLQDVEEFDGPSLKEDDIEVEPPAPTARHTSSSTPNQQVQRIWTEEEKNDLIKLKNIISHFIAVPQFKQATKPIMMTHVINPLVDLNGPFSGSIAVLEQVMQSTMLRHRIDDIEAEVVLPPITHEHVFLDLDPYALKTYNVLQAHIAINIVEFKGKGPDCLLHSESHGKLNEAKHNLFQSMFWKNIDDLSRTDELVQNAAESMEEYARDGVSIEDQELARKAFHHLEIAANDNIWRAMHTRNDITYRIRGLEPMVFEAWTRIPLRESGSSTALQLIQADRLVKLLNIIKERPFIQEAGLVAKGREEVSEDKKREDLYYEYINSLGVTTSELSRSQFERWLMQPPKGSIVSVKKAPKQLQRELEELISRAANGEEAPREESQWPSLFSLSNRLKGVRLCSTTSSKLNYILDEILTHSPKEKFIVFSDQPLTLAHIAEALELVQVKFLKLLTETPMEIRNQTVVAFEISEEYRVLLAELKHGSRGLNIVSASRIIFCEPIPKADVENQAIKRAHRLGQQRPVLVKTLAIRNTIEEGVLHYRHGNDAAATEPEFKEYISGPEFKFIEQPSIPTPSADLNWKLGSRVSCAGKAPLTLNQMPQSRLPKRPMVPSEAEPVAESRQLKRCRRELKALAM